MANVNDDEYETLNLADESEWMDEEDGDKERDDHPAVAEPIGMAGLDNETADVVNKALAAGYVDPVDYDD
jgi:hypothetical protein